MFKLVNIGDKWGALECTFAGKRTVNTDEGGGIMRTAEVYCYVLTCECGRQLVIPRVEFKGKRVVQDCGCGLAAKGAAVVVSISIPGDLKLELTREARKQNVNISQMAATLMRRGLHGQPKPVEAPKLEVEKEEEQDWYEEMNQIHRAKTRS